MIFGRRSIEYVAGLEHDLACARRETDTQREAIEKLGGRLEESLITNATLALQLALARTDLHAERQMRETEPGKKQLHVV